MTHEILTALTTALAVSVELIEALAIVFAVGVSRRWGDALAGAAAGVAASAAVGIAISFGLLSGIPITTLRLVIGILLMCFGLEWLRKGTLRIAGLKARSSAGEEYDETLVQLEDDPLPPLGSADWAGRAIAFKGVLLEGVEIALIVSVIASQPGSAGPALVGAMVAAVIAVCAGVVAHGRFSDLPETEVKWGVGILLCSFGVFFVAEGLEFDWPGGDLALLYVAAAFAAASRVQISVLRPGLKVSSP